MPRSYSMLSTLACLMGAAGVALAALSSHAGGGELGRTASEFLVLHAGALLGVGAHARAPQSAAPRVALVCAWALALGTCLFSGDLAARAFAGAKLFPMAAPLGGGLMILSWLGLAVCFAAAGAREEA